MALTTMFLLLWIVLISCLADTEAFSVVRKATEDKLKPSLEVITHGSSRRNVMEGFLGAMTTSMLLPVAAQAACLMGDTSEDCIGIYKMPMDDEVLQFVDTAEKLNRFAPGIRWVPPVEYPKSYNDARTEILSLKDLVSSLNDIVLKGKLVEAGTLLLGIVPRLTVSGRVMIRALEATKGNTEDLSMRALRLEASHTELLGKLGQCDIIIGQALSGQLGSTTFAQIQILGDVREADELFNEMIQAIPETNIGKRK